MPPGAARAPGPPPATGPDEKAWTTAEAAAYLQVPESTLQGWRRRQYGPRPHRIGRHIRYLPTEVRAWLHAQTGDAA